MPNQTALRMTLFHFPSNTRRVSLVADVQTSRCLGPSHRQSLVIKLTSQWVTHI